LHVRHAFTRNQAQLNTNEEQAEEAKASMFLMHLTGAAGVD
jgi:hypothetical protein